MRIRFFVFLFLFAIVLPGFPATPTQSNSGSSTLGKPSVKFKEWQIGRSLKSSDSQNNAPNSFITTSETACRFTASVGYDGNQGDSVSPIDPSTVEWRVIDKDPSSMALDASSMSKNWSGAKHPSKLDPSTSFNVVGQISVPTFNSNTSCSHSDAERLNRTPRHRSNTKLGFTLQFTANTEDGQSVEKKLVLKADAIDQVRQEYVDYNKPIPERGDSKWQTQDTYDFGHYQIMLNYSLAHHHQKWVDEINKLKGANVAAFAVGDFVLTSGYRHPHHNYEHTPSTAALSPHMYGYALDVRGKTDAQNQPLDINGDEQNTDADREDMATAAKPNAGARYTNIYSSKHVHADWAPDAPVKWVNRKNTSDDAPLFSLPPQGTDQPVTAAPAPPAPVTGDCGIHTISTSQAANHASVNFACASHTYYACQTPATSETNRHSHQTLPCGSHSGYRCTATSSHTQTTTCPSDTNGQSCSYGSYYACSPHTHAYPEPPANPPTPAPPPPAPTTVACGGAPWTNCPGASSRKAHHVPSCSHCNNGYWTCGQYAYRHTTQNTCRRPGCGVTYYECQNGPCSSDWGTYDWHWAE